jgi:hypothetical protein
MEHDVARFPSQERDRTDPGERSRVPTSVILERLVQAAPPGTVALSWLVDNLGARSFGILMLLMALVGLVPGASAVIGVLLAFPASQMILARPAPVLPRFIIGRSVPTDRLSRLLKRVIPALSFLERVVRPRWRTPFEATKRVVGSVILLLGVTMLVPIPFSHVIPALVIMLLALAFLEEDGVLLCIALAAAMVSLSITAAAVWGVVAAGRLL